MTFSADRKSQTVPEAPIDDDRFALYDRGTDAAEGHGLERELLATRVRRIAQHEYFVFRSALDDHVVGENQLAIVRYRQLVPDAVSASRHIRGNAEQRRYR